MDGIESSGRVVTDGPEETRRLAHRLVCLLQHGDVVALFGDLGSGKTNLVQGMCEALGVEDVVNSPTFILINQYEGHLAGEGVTLYHCDLYRLSAAEFEALGSEELFEAGGLCFVEWADRAGERLPLPRWEIRLDHLGESERAISWRRVTQPDQTVVGRAEEQET